MKALALALNDVVFARCVYSCPIACVINWLINGLDLSKGGELRVAAIAVCSSVALVPRMLEVI